MPLKYDKDVINEYAKKKVLSVILWKSNAPGRSIIIYIRK